MTAVTDERLRRLLMDALPYVEASNRVRAERVLADIRAALDEPATPVSTATEDVVEAAVQAALNAGVAVNGEHGVAAARVAARYVVAALQAQPVSTAIDEDAGCVVCGGPRLSSGAVCSFECSYRLAAMNKEGTAVVTDERLGTRKLLHQVKLFLANVAQMLDEMKVERGGNWTEWNQQQRDELTQLLLDINEAQQMRRMIEGVEPSPTDHCGIVEVGSGFYDPAEGDDGLAKPDPKV